MKVSGNGYRVTYEDDVLTISGKLSLMLDEYDEIDRLFIQVVNSCSGDLSVDLRNLEYLNSAGIHTLCVKLILEAADVEGFSMELLCSNDFTWQKETIPTFEDLMDNMTITFQ